MNDKPVHDPSRLAWLLILPLALFTGCGTLGLKQPQQVWVSADRARYEVIAPRFKAYVEADASLTQPQKDNLTGLLVDWELVLKEAEKAVNVVQ